MSEKKGDAKTTKKEEQPKTSEPGMVWTLVENFLKNMLAQAEKKIQQGAEEFSFFLKKKMVAFFFIFMGGALLLVGFALVLEKVLALWGLTGWGFVITGGFSLILAGLINKIRR